MAYLYLVRPLSHRHHTLSEANEFLAAKPNENRLVHSIDRIHVFGFYHYGGCLGRLDGPADQSIKTLFTDGQVSEVVFGDWYAVPYHIQLAGLTSVPRYSCAQGTRAQCPLFPVSNLLLFIGMSDCAIFTKSEKGSITVALHEPSMIEDLLEIYRVA